MSSVESVEKSTNALSKAELWKLRRACQDFEAIFVASLLRTARQAAQSEPADGVSGLYLDMADTALADAVARGGGFGIAKLLEQELTRLASRMKSEGQR
ncbi:MAG: hypothetical protein ACP5R4_14635 [Armatimonadota bacterium]